MELELYDHPMIIEEWDDGPDGWFRERLHWLPDADDCGNLVEDFAFLLTGPNESGAEPRLAEAPPPPKSAITLAIEYESLLSSGLVNTQMELAAQAGVSSARISQFRRLLSLPSRILDYLRQLPEDKRREYNERALRHIVLQETAAAQVAAFQQLRQQVE
jgi:hypothetical protein